MNKIHLDTSGVQTISVVEAKADAASTGESAQPANLLTPQETSALPGKDTQGETLEAKLSGQGDAAKLVTVPTKDPNAQKEATTVAPNTGPGTIVAMTEEKAVTETETEKEE